MDVLIFLCLLGVAAGILSGLLGIGGGLIVVPGLAFLFKIKHIPNNILMQLAVGTSLAIMIPTAFRSLQLHLRYSMEAWPIYRKIFCGVLAGTICGAALAYYLHSQILIFLFAIFMFISCIKTFFEDSQESASPSLPNTWIMNAVGVIIGSSSSLLGVGGGFLTVPFLIFHNVSVRNALVVSVAVSLTVASIGTINFIHNGWHAPGLPTWATGYVYWPVWLPVSLASIVFAPLGARWSHALPVKTLRKFFSVLWLFISIYMFWLACTVSR